MPTLHEINEFAGRIGDAYGPQAVILFGSYAHGTARPDSDVDLLVVMPFDGSAYGKAIDILRQLLPPFWAHVVVRTPQDTRDRYALGDPVVRDAIDRGRVLFGTAA